jgi:hypothetical protein
MANIVNRGGMQGSYQPANSLEAQEYQKIVQEYMDFLDDRGEKTVNSRKIDDLIATNKCRLVVNLNDLRRTNGPRCIR